MRALLAVLLAVRGRGRRHAGRRARVRGRSAGRRRPAGCCWPRCRPAASPAASSTARARGRARRAPARVLLALLGGGFACSRPRASPLVLAALLALAGLVLAPTTVVGSTLLDRVAPPGTATEAFTVMVMGIVAGRRPATRSAARSSRAPRSRPRSSRPAASPPRARWSRSGFAHLDSAGLSAGRSTPTHSHVKGVCAMSVQRRVSPAVIAAVALLVFPAAGFAAPRNDDFGRRHAARRVPARRCAEPHQRRRDRADRRAVDVRRRAAHEYGLVSRARLRRPADGRDARSGIDTVMAVYDTDGSGTNGNDPPAEANLIGCDDDIADDIVDERASEVTFDSEDGVDYLVQIGTCTGCGSGRPDEGAVAFIAYDIPPNDDRGTAPALLNLTPARADNVGATLESGERTSCGGAPFGKTVWFRFSAPGPGVAAFSAGGSSFDSVITVYRGTAFVACNDDAGATEGSSRVSIHVTAGKVLHAGRRLRHRRRGGLRLVRRAGQLQWRRPDGGPQPRRRRHPRRLRPLPGRERQRPRRQPRRLPRPAPPAAAEDAARDWSRASSTPSAASPSSGRWAANNVPAG